MRLVQLTCCKVERVISHEHGTVCIAYLNQYSKPQETYPYLLPTGEVIVHYADGGDPPFEVGKKYNILISEAKGGE